jgi:hypothetical protein
MSGLTPENSAIQMTPELEKAVSEAPSAAAIAEILHQAAVDQKIVFRENDPSILSPVPAGTAPRKFAEVITDPVTGERKIFEGDTEADALKQATEYMKTLFAKQRTASGEIRQQEQQRDPYTGQFISDADARVAAEADAIAKSELTRRFQNGEISPDVYLLETGAIDRAIVRKQQEDADLQGSWQEATEEFLQGPGSDWPGGEVNRRKMSDILQQMGAVNEPSVENLARAYKYMVENNLMQSSHEMEERKRQSELQQKISEATTPDQLRQILGYRGETVGRDWWGR